MNEDQRAAGKGNRAAAPRTAASVKAAAGTKSTKSPKSAKAATGTAALKAGASAAAIGAGTRRAGTAGRAVAAKASRTPAHKRAASDRATAAEPVVVRTVVTAVATTERHRLIAQCAYYRAERRGWVTGCELEDWLAAEREVDAMLTARVAALARRKP